MSSNPSAIGTDWPYRRIGRHLGTSDHAARALVERAQAALRRLLD